MSIEKAVRAADLCYVPCPGSTRLGQREPVLLLSSHGEGPWYTGLLSGRIPIKEGRMTLSIACGKWRMKHLAGRIVLTACEPRGCISEKRWLNLGRDQDAHAPL